MVMTPLSKVMVYIRSPKLASYTPSRTEVSIAGASGVAGTSPSSATLVSVIGIIKPAGWMVKKPPMSLPIMNSSVFTMGVPSSTV